MNGLQIDLVLVMALCVAFGLRIGRGHVGWVDLVLVVAGGIGGLVAQTNILLALHLVSLSVPAGLMPLGRGLAAVGAVGLVYAACRKPVKRV